MANSYRSCLPFIVCPFACDDLTVVKIVGEAGEMSVDNIPILVALNETQNRLYSSYVPNLLVVYC